MLLNKAHIESLDGVVIYKWRVSQVHVTTRSATLRPKSIQTLTSDPIIQTKSEKVLINKSNSPDAQFCPAHFDTLLVELR